MCQGGRAFKAGLGKVIDSLHRGVKSRKLLFVGGVHELDNSGGLLYRVFVHLLLDSLVTGTASEGAGSQATLASPVHPP